MKRAVFGLQLLRKLNKPGSLLSVIRSSPCLPTLNLRMAEVHDGPGEFSGIKSKLSERIKVKLSNDLSKAEICMPGFGMGDLDRSMRVAAHKLAKMGEAGRMSAFSMLGNYGNASLYNMEQLAQERLLFLVSNSFQISPNFYKPSVLFQPLVYKISMINKGRSSISQLDEVYAHDSGDLLSQAVVKIVFVDKESRKPIDLPDWFREKFSDINNPTPSNINPDDKLSIMVPPADCYVYKTYIRYSDLDYYFHTNHASYVRIVTDASNTAYNKGKLKAFSKDLSFYNVKKMHFMYAGESTAGEQVEVLVWQDDLDPATVYTQLQKQNAPLFVAKFVYDLTAPVKPKI